MPMTNKLLGDIFFGNELEKLDRGTAKTLDMVESYLGQGASRLREKRERVVQMATNFSKKRNRGRFGGMITAGDAVFIGAFLAGLRPRSVVELGVCSGQSSAFILVASERLGLLRDEEKFLYSIDAVTHFGPDKLPVGQVVDLEYPARKPHWSLHTEHTVMAVRDPEHPIQDIKSRGGAVVAFVDAEHAHPWPLIDVAILSEWLPKGSWILLQDIQLTERWLANSIERGVPCPRPQRGVGLVFNHWPGTKFAGQEMCYNMAAIQTGISAPQRRAFLDACRSYASELEGEARDQANELLRDLS